MKKYDLHIHSTFSDGEYSPEQIIDKLRENNIDIFSITDHDNADSVLEMEKIDTKGLLYIPGIEFSAEKGVFKMHILGYGIDGHNKELTKTCENMKIRKSIRNLEVIQQLRDKYGFVITKEETIDLLNRKSFVGQTTIAKLLVQKGIIPNVKYYFDNLFKGIEPKTKATIDLEEAIRVIHNSGGMAIIAHPISIENAYNVKIDEIFGMFKKSGIDGIEIFNSKHSLSDIKRYYRLARDENLLISGGSDYHGEIMKPNVKLGKISKDNSESKEHYCMTVIQAYCSKNKLRNIENDKESEEIER